VQLAWQEDLLVSYYAGEREVREIWRPYVISLHDDLHDELLQDIRNKTETKHYRQQLSCRLDEEAESTATQSNMTTTPFTPAAKVRGTTFEMRE
jgi:hypothetical protein